MVRATDHPATGVRSGSASKLLISRGSIVTFSVELHAPLVRRRGRPFDAVHQSGVIGVPTATATSRAKSAEFCDSHVAVCGTCE